MTHGTSFWIMRAALHMGHHRIALVPYTLWLQDDLLPESQVLIQVPTAIIAVRAENSQALMRRIYETWT